MAEPHSAEPSATGPLLSVAGVEKTFCMHLRGGALIPVMRDAGLTLHPGECLALGGPSGAGKSSLIKMIYGNYGVDGGTILVRRPGGTVDLATAEPRTVIALRRDTIGYVSQFLRVIPRVCALDVVAEPARAQGMAADEARARAAALLERLNLPRRLWDLPPATFSGGEQQRVNVARGFIAHFPILLLDEPTASLDAANRDVVVSLIEEKKAAGVGMIGIFHDAAVRDRVADRIIDLTTFAPPAAA